MKSFLLKYSISRVNWFLAKLVFVISSVLFGYIGGTIVGVIPAMLIGCLVAMFFVLFFAIFTTELMDRYTMILGPENQILQVIENGGFYWKWDPIWTSGRFVSYEADRYWLCMKLDPLTENPKVRHLQYSVDLLAKGTPEDARGYYSRFGQDGPHTYVKSLLFDFNEVYSRELAKLYNPLNKNQQNQFSGMLDSYLTPHLVGTGVRLQSARFDDALNSIH